MHAFPSFGCYFRTPGPLAAVAMSTPRYTLGWVHNLNVAPATSDAITVIGLGAAFSTAAVVFTALRLGVRWKIVGSIGLDDAAITASAVCRLCLRNICFATIVTDNLPKVLGVAYSATAIYRMSSMVVVPEVWSSNDDGYRDQMGTWLRRGFVPA